MKDRDSSALWKSIEATLRKEIEEGTLSPGQQLATEIGLSERFCVSRSTVRRALVELEKKGLVRIEHGRGLFVSEDVVPFAIGERTRYSENMRRLNIPGQRQILGIQMVEADELVESHLKLSSERRVFLVESLIFNKGQPLGLTNDYYSVERFPQLAKVMLEHASVTNALGFLGVKDYKRKRTQITGRLPSAREARLLKIARSRPVLEVQKLDVDLNGAPVAFGKGCHSADRIQFFIE